MTLDVVGVVAHQDDFELVLGAMARVHQAAGKRVHVLVLTDGTGSAVQAQLGMSDEEFTWHRDDEQRRAARALGIRPEDVHLPSNRARAGELTADWADFLVMDFLYDFPGASVKVHSWRPGQHADHAAAGLGVRQIHQRGETTDPRYYAPPWPAGLSTWKAANPGVHLSAQRADATGVGRIRKAFLEYADVDPLGYKVGIGRKSVDYFDQLQEDPVNYWHLP